MRKPDVETVLDAARERLCGFDATEITYLDVDGRWSGPPETRRDRISSELWFRIWESAKGGDDGPVRELFSLFLSDGEAFDLARALVRSIPFDLPKGDILLLMDRALVRLLEYDIDSRNAESDVAIWDRKAWRKRDHFTQQVKEFLESVRGARKGGGRIERLFHVLEELRGKDSGIFRQVGRIVAEEETLRWESQEVEDTGPDARSDLHGQSWIGMHAPLSLPSSSRVPEALLRPCCELLSNERVEIGSGLPYQASLLLGKLQDPRAFGTLIRALRHTDIEYTSLRTALVYAIGTLRQKQALDALIQVLDGPDSVPVRRGEGSAEFVQPRHPEKREAIWALGKLGADAVPAIPVLSRFSDHRDGELRSILAWALGKIGEGQKRETGGLDAEIVRTLLHLLTTEESLPFEEAAVALKNLGLPDFLHSLYLHNFASVPLLQLKPSRTGLYELSETLLHLTTLKHPVVMAVTGDSGTGKTYFCQAIREGFAGIRAHEILYLMRDLPAKKIFNAMLGLEWLRQYINPEYYRDSCPTESEDDPDAFFERFREEHSNKKLIILDGWRDDVYFHPVINKFYEKGCLDVIVKFRTTHSTRRLNLEERERSLDRVTDHLPLQETPDIEETRFYREGAVLIYALDNSHDSRLSAEETREVFERRKVESWGDQIRIGPFERETRGMKSFDEVLPTRTETLVPRSIPIAGERSESFVPNEETFERIPNEAADSHPNLLESVRLRDTDVDLIAFYSQGQIAYTGEDGRVGILTGFNDRALFARLDGTPVTSLAVCGGDLLLSGIEGILRRISFRARTVLTVSEADVPVTALAPYRDSGIVTGHADGTLRLLAWGTGEARSFPGHAGPITALSTDRRGRIASASEDGELRVTDLERGSSSIQRGLEGRVLALSFYPDGRVVTCMHLDDLTGEPVRTGLTRIRIADLGTGICRTLEIPDSGPAQCMSIYFDGRILLGLKNRSELTPANTLIVVHPPSGAEGYQTLEGHRLETRRCVTMGPRIITCGREEPARNALKIWGTEAYVRRERDKLNLLPAGMARPPYYRSLF